MNNTHISLQEKMAGEGEESSSSPRGSQRMAGRRKSLVERRRQAVGPGRRAMGPGRLLMEGRMTSMEETRFISSPGLKDGKQTLM